MLRVVLVCLLLAAEALAQQPGRPAGTARPQGPLPGARVQRPPRDPADHPTGTSVIRGRVVAADTGTPIRRAYVRLSSGEARESRGTRTDAQGRFEFRDLPAGRWELLATKAGFVPLRFGQRRPFEAGRPIELSEGETMARANLALPRGAAVTGRILDDFGDPVAGASVRAVRYRSRQGPWQMMSAGGDNTDDTGAFRLYGLMPGEYYITAVPQSGMFMEDSTDTTGYAATYYPGTSNAAEAQRISVGAGQEVTNVTFALLPTRTVRITGTVVDSKGERLSNAFVMLQDTSEATGGVMMMGRNTGRVRPDGSFRISNVTPGSYTLVVNSAMGGMGDRNEEPEFATMRLTVGGEDISGIHLVTSRGATVSGSLVAAAGSAGNPDPNGVMVMHHAPGPEIFMGMGSRPAKVNQDGTFTVYGVHGQRVFRVMGLPPSWMLKAVVLNGEDVTDRGVDLKAADEVTGLQILVTDRIPEVSGKVTDARGEPARDYTVLIFPADSSKWGVASRFIHTGRPDQDGLFRIRALPPVEDYLAVAVEYLDEGEGRAPEFLESMRDRATPLSLGDGEVKALDLRLVTR